MSGNASTVFPIGCSIQCADADTLVIHLRSGDVADLSHPTYVINPLCYCKWLSTIHNKCIIVTEDDRPHFLLSRIQTLFDSCIIVSNDTFQDFALLRSSVNLATSGVGTFAIAAALLSSSLRSFYCSDLFLKEHLNPGHLNRNRIVQNVFRAGDFFRLWKRAGKFERWSLLRGFEPRGVASR